MPARDISPLLAALLECHPWYVQQITNAAEWPLMRAVTGTFNEDFTKRRFLLKAKFENDDHYSTRVGLSQFLGKTDGISSGFAGAVFTRQPEVTFPDDALGAELKEWADDVDGMRTTLNEILEEQSDEAIPMGLCGFYVDKQLPDPQKLADFFARTGRLQPQTREEEIELGMRWPRVVKFPAECITNWQFDTSGRLEWVKLCRVLDRQPNPLLPREVVVQWIVLDRAFAQVFEAKARVSPPVTPNAPQTVNREITFPVTADQVEEPTAVIQVAHRCNMVPFAIYYGGGRKVAPLQARSLLEGCKRADVSCFNERSWGKFARYLHNVPVFKIISDRPIEEIVRDTSNALQLSSEGKEDAKYESTPSDAFATSMAAVEEENLEAFRQAGADPSGQFEGSASKPESGVAKSQRFRNTEARSLKRISAAASDCHNDLFELAARRLMPEAPPISERAWEGSVRYSSRFDLADVAELLDQYGKAGNWIKSESWHRGMLLRIALLLRGEVSQEEAETIEQEIESGELPDTRTPQEKTADLAVESGVSVKTAGQAGQAPRTPAPKQPGE